MKRVAIIDRCWDCMACRFCDKAGVEIPDDCPLRPMPSHLVDVVLAPDSALDEVSYMTGWNDCLDAIGGEK